MVFIEKEVFDCSIYFLAKIRKKFIRINTRFYSWVSLVFGRRTKKRSHTSLGLAQRFYAFILALFAFESQKVCRSTSSSFISYRSWSCSSYFRSHLHWSEFTWARTGFRQFRSTLLFIAIHKDVSHIFDGRYGIFALFVDLYRLVLAWARNSLFCFDFNVSEQSFSKRKLSPIYGTFWFISAGGRQLGFLFDFHCDSSKAGILSTESDGGRSQIQRKLADVVLVGTGTLLFSTQRWPLPIAERAAPRFRCGFRVVLEIRWAGSMQAYVLVWELKRGALANLQQCLLMDVFWTWLR